MYCVSVPVLDRPNFDLVSKAAKLTNIVARLEVNA
jgi:hypothetical protein